MSIPRNFDQRLEAADASQVERRLTEAERLGFRCCLLPAASLARAKATTRLELLPAATLWEALRAALG